MALNRCANERNAARSVLAPASTRTPSHVSMAAGRHPRLCASRVGDHDAVCRLGAVVAVPEYRQHLRPRIDGSKSVAANDTTRLPPAAQAARRSWDNSPDRTLLRRGGAATSAGVGCRGSPIDRLIGASVRVGVTSANHWRSRSKGSGCSRDRRGFNMTTAGRKRELCGTGNAAATSTRAADGRAPAAGNR